MSVADDGDRSAGRALAVLATGPLAAGVRALDGAPWLDVALWAVLAPILVATVLALVQRARQQVPAAHGRRAEVVLPDAGRDALRPGSSAPRPPGT